MILSNDYTVHIEPEHGGGYVAHVARHTGLSTSIHTRAVARGADDISCESGARAWIKQEEQRLAEIGRNRAKCEAYRRRVGKPAGPGKPGNKRH